LLGHAKTSGRRGARSFLVIGLLAVLLVQLAGGALAEPRNPDGRQVELRARTLMAKLQEQYDAMERLTEQINEIGAREAGLVRQLRELDRRRERVEQELARVQRLLDEQVRSTYIVGPGDLMGDLVTAPDLPEALNRVPLQRAILEARVAALEDVRRSKADLDSVKKQIEDALAAQRNAKRAITDQRARLKTMADQLRATLGRVDPELAAALAALEQFDEHARRASWDAFWAGGAGGRGMLGGAWYLPGAAARRAVAYALDHLGAPYVWGAAGPNAFDCSGLTMAAYAAAGVAIPRVSRAQWGAGRHVDLASLIPGDLVFFADNTADPSTIHHVGIYVGRGLMVHAPHTGDVVRTASIWRSGYIGAVRVSPGGAKPGVIPPPPGPPATGPPPTMTTRRPTTTTPPATRPPATTAPPTTSAPSTTAAPPTTGATTTTTVPATTVPSTTTG
jgi:peptidoglycan DL-endopeptidase CwlO